MQEKAKEGETDVENNGHQDRIVTCVNWAEMRGLRPTMEDTLYINKSYRGLLLYLLVQPILFIWHAMLK